MSNTIATAGGDVESFDQHSNKTKRVLAVLPEGYRKAVGFFWALNSHLLPTPTPLALRFQIWIQQEGLTEDDCKAILRKLTTPEASAKHRFASDLLTDLATEVDAVTKQRKQLAEAARLREYEAARNANNLPPDAVREALAKNDFLSQFLTPDPEVTR